MEMAVKTSAMLARGRTPRGSSVRFAVWSNDRQIRHDCRRCGARAVLFGHFHRNRIVTLCPPFAAPLCAQKGRFSVFVSFFPQPKLFFLSAVVWSLVARAALVLRRRAARAVVGLPPARRTRRRSSASGLLVAALSCGSTSISALASSSSTSSGRGIRRIRGRTGRSSARR